MLGRCLILAALSLWVTASALICVRAPETPPPGVTKPERIVASNKRLAENLTGLPFRSVSMQLQRTDWLDKYEDSIDRIAALGADTVKFVVDPRMEHGESNRIYLDMRMTPTPEALQRLIKHAKSRNLRVILMPIVLLDAPRKATEWRGTIKPESWDKWFESYTEMMVHFSWIAEVSGVDLLVVGSELVSTETRNNDWQKVIAKVRSIYKGKLTYSSNWDHYTVVPFWDQLDLIGMNSYWSLDEGKKSDATIEDIKIAWANIQADLLPFAAGHRKPIIFLEAGWCSIANAAHEPWDYTRSDQPEDPDLQRRLYEGFFQTWYGHPQLGGFSIWEWTPNPDPKDRASVEKAARGYTPEHKPAEAVLRSFLARPPWPVNPNRNTPKSNTTGSAR